VSCLAELVGAMIELGIGDSCDEHGPRFWQSIWQTALPGRPAQRGWLAVAGVLGVRLLAVLAVHRTLGLLGVEPEPALFAPQPNRAELVGVAVHPAALHAEQPRECRRVDKLAGTSTLVASVEQLDHALRDRVHEREIPR
jgi:hypothetical protein